ncbi:uncharacterized protein LOC131216023 [Anopheles bellator]|uniref:uncharacterized protein LOC131216023 n=1 Tax=Anopheles bellator TaxID=139047 RepID=UPI002648163C|nr:uncharacterized protein LOC131216023 [Anopheles bellator]
MLKKRAAILVIFFCLSASAAPVPEAAQRQRPGELSQESRAIALIHHLTYLIDYLVHYVLGARDRKTPPEAVDYYQTALVEGQEAQSADEKSRHHKPSAARAQQEMEALDKMMKS